MKRIVQEPGVRKWSGEDFLALQEEPLKVLDLMFKPYGSCIIEGCELVGNEIKPGIVALEGVDTNGQPTFKVVPFSGAKDLPTASVYSLYLAVETDVREYADGSVKSVSHNYYAKLAISSIPPGAISIPKGGSGKRLLDAIQGANRRFVTDAEKKTWGSKASTAVVSTSANGLMSSADKTKLDGVAAKANNYEHPNAHPASMITESSSKQFVSDAEKNNWNAKASTAVASTSANGLMSSADKAKLNKYPADGRGWGQMNAPTLLKSIEEVDACREIGFYGVTGPLIDAKPNTDGSLFVMGGLNDTKQIAWDEILTFKFRGNDKPEIANSAWSPWYDFWHSGNSAQFTSGEKTKLNGIAANANNYTHPSSHSADMIDETADKCFINEYQRDMLSPPNMLRPGLVPKLPLNSDTFLKGNGEWSALPTVSSSKAGVIPSSWFDVLQKIALEKHVRIQSTEPTGSILFKGLIWIKP